MSQEKNLKNGDKAADGFTFVFGKVNYILLVAGVVLLAIGYILLMGGGSDDSAVFNPAMFDNRRLVASPVCITLGFIVVIVSIMLKTKEKDNTQN